LRDLILAAAVFLAASLYGAACAADTTAIAFQQPETTASRDSATVFGGLMSTRSLGATILFDFNKSPPYDNYIAGVAYDRDLWTLARVLKIGVEVGAADRFGHYVECCDTKIYSSSLVHSGEFWGGPRLRYEGLVLFDTLRIAPAVTLGFSATTNSIGRERERELTQNGNARFLFYFGPEVAFSLRKHANVELTCGVHHRSGANRALGHIEEGYDASTLGLRYRF
jgi:hypothetical protein